MSKKEDVLRQQILSFLAANAQINKINFSLKHYKVYPRAYRFDVYNAIKKKDVEIVLDSDLLLSPEAAKYKSRYLFFADDRICISPIFSINNMLDQGYLIHECTHAHIDNQSIGKHSYHENEAVGYVAHAVFLKARSKATKTLLPSNKIRIFNIAFRIAERVLAGSYKVDNFDANELKKAISVHPTYSATKNQYSDGV